MKEYLLCVIGTVLLCSLITSIAPEGRTSASVKGVAKLICVLAIIAPVLNFLKSGSLGVFADKNSQEFFSNEVIQAEETFIQYYSEMRIKQAETALEEEIFEEYALTVEVTLDCCLEQEIKVEQIYIQIPKDTGEEVKGEIYRRMTEKYCSEVLIE